jgi:UDP-N-acetylmuramate dehydrogenase
LINKGGAAAEDVIQLAAYVREQVLQKFAVSLEHEVRFIDAQGETQLQQVIKHV